MLRNLQNNYYIKKYNIQSNILLGKNILADNPLKFVDEAIEAKNFLIIADENTHPLCQNFIEAHFAEAKMLILKNGVKPLKSLCEKIAYSYENISHILAIGSGTVNDIAKYSSCLMGVSYSIIATACSQNGYTSANASLIDESGQKQSFKAHMASNILLDVDILKTAPLRLNQSGYADAICRYTAGFDYKLAHKKTGAEYNEDALLITKESEEKIFQPSFKFDDEGLLNLAENLILSGLAMSIAGSSAPASGAEHMLAHYLEAKSKLDDILHGEAVGVLAILTAKLQEVIYGKDGVEKTSLQIYKLLKNAGCKTHYKQFNLQKTDIKDALKNAKHTRDRYTILNEV